MKKLTNQRVNHQLLQRRADGHRAAGYDTPKWIFFCQVLLGMEFTLEVYEARRTFSKYITVKMAGHRDFKVRFSNHKPILERELRGDCDFFVGRTNLRVTNTQNALNAVYKHFGLIK